VSYDILVLFGILAVSASLYSFYAGFEFNRQVTIAINRPKSGFKPKVCLVMPCKGAEPGLGTNIEAMLRQDYVNYFAVVVADSYQDSAYAIASQILAINPSSNTQIQVAEPPLRASGKVAALLTALSKTKGQAEVYAFVDSDARIPPDWLTGLVDPLIDGSVGATTGFRWYFPLHGGVWSHLGATWNASGTNLLFNARYNFPWGGGMAVRSEALSKIGIENEWATAISDDMALSSALRQHGYSVVFLPQCTVATFIQFDLPHLVEWATRQTVLTRVFNPKVWRYALVAYAFLDLVFLLGLVGLSLGVMLNPIWLIPSVLLLTPTDSGFMRSWQRYSTFRRVLPHLSTEFDRDRYPHVAVSFLVPWIMIYCIIKSSLTHAIEWRGRKYNLSGRSSV